MSSGAAGGGTMVPGNFAKRFLSRIIRTLGCLQFIGVIQTALGADVPKAPVPPSPYLPIIYRYADAILERGRGTNGAFLRALRRSSLEPTNPPVAPPGIRENFRAPTNNLAAGGSNPFHHENLLRLLYTLSELSGKPKYREAAIGELKWFAQHGQPSHFRPWVLWDRCFDVTPDASKRLANAVGIDSNDSPREMGFAIRTWSVAYARTRDEQFLRRIEDALSRVDSNGGLSAANAAFVLSLAIDCDGAAHRVPESLATRLRTVAAQADDIYCAGQTAAPLWNARQGPTLAQLGMMCVSRYDNAGRIAYRDRIHAAANAYLKSAPPENADLWPVTLGQAISLQLAAWRSTAQPQYLVRARAFADFALQEFFDGSPLPRASLKADHYETVAGADTLALALVELHLQVLHITAVRCPPNTIDR